MIMSSETEALSRMVPASLGRHWFAASGDLAKGGAVAARILKP